jgi:alkylation response protein AidB-like acyl-CoA dehydrogenase
MKTSLPPTPKGAARENSGAPLIDTSRMSAGQRAALEMAEAARDDRQNTGYAASLFFGSPDTSRLLPFPRQTEEDQDQGNAFLQRLRAVLERHADPDAIDRDGEIPEPLIHALAEIGAFGIKIPREYGGLGLSQTNYSRAAALLGGVCGNLTALLSAHQSIGAPQPLLLFGTDEQKARYLPRCAAGEISAFALTEPDVGSDPARMGTRAELSPDGTHYVLTGEKLWTTNGTRAGIIVVMARTPLPDKPHATTAFIVETAWPGVEVTRRCHFMGLRALYNAVMRFEGVKVPVENVLGGVGRGLKVALTTLNTGRITLPAACSGLASRCLEISSRWARDREQWGSPISRHAAIADKLARMAADSFALDAVVRYVSSLVDADKRADVRLEAALAKLWGSEAAWRIADDTMQIRGGRGYETAGSLAARGERPDPVERLFRDARINTIFEGSSEIMRLFIAREALDPHLRIGAAAVNSTLPWGRRIASAFKAGVFYSRWYPSLWLPAKSPEEAANIHPDLRLDLKAVNRLSRRLARSLFHAMALNGPALERRQVLLGHLVDIGAELFVWSCAIGHAAKRISAADCAQQEVERVLGLARHFGLLARQRVNRSFASLGRNTLERESRKLVRDLEGGGR